MTTAKKTAKKAVRKIKTIRQSEKIMSDARALRNAALREATSEQHEGPGFRITMVEEDIETVKEKIRYNPPPPNPTVLALQEHILGLVTERTQAQKEIGVTNINLRMAQAQADSAREHLLQIENEVQYRLQLIAQIEGRPQETQITGYRAPSFRISPAEEQFAYDRVNESYPVPFNNAAPEGIGSIPARASRPPAGGIVGEARTESAEEIRAAM